MKKRWCVCVCVKIEFSKKVKKTQRLGSRELFARVVEGEVDFGGGWVVSRSENKMAQYRARLNPNPNM
jgi:hypothetical protein